MPSKKTHWISATELLETKNEALRYLWQPFMPYAAPVMLTGPSDSGKSRLARQLAIAVASKKDSFLGYKLNSMSGNVCYICTEDYAPQVKSYLAQETKSLGIDKLDNLQFLFDSENVLNDLESFLETNKVDLIVVDTWSDIFGGNPNNWADVRENLTSFRDIIVRHECTILFLHHNVKNSEKTEPDKNKVNGSQAIEAKIRVVLELREGLNDSERVLTIVKANHLPKAEKGIGIVLEIDDETLLFSNTGRKMNFNGHGNEKKAKYDKELWVDRMMKLREKEDLSFEEAREKLVKDYPDEDVPGVTWFKINCKEKASQSTSTEGSQTDQEHESEETNQSNEKNDNHDKE